ncbi:MAG: endonuclease NucS domain-containing protein [Xenococcaceae cyanobacterium]
MNQRNPTLPRFRIYGEIAEFETERHLEWFFWDTVLIKIGLTPLKRQYTCRNGICDILAKGTENQLVIIELKNTQDSHVIEQVTAYFDALKEEQPFAEEIDYTKPIDLYAVCPSYNNRTELILKYHKLDLTLLCYTLKRNSQSFDFILYQWFTKIEIVVIKIPLATTIPSLFNLPDPPKSFVDLLGKSSEDEKKWITQVRDRIYQFSQEFNYKIYEKPYGKWTRFERNKKNPIAEVGWDNKRDSLAIYLWLPFTTINGRWNMRMRGGREENYNRTAMMRLWLIDGIVTYVGYIHNGRKSWLIFTSDELENERFSLPSKLKKQKWSGNARYWKGLAMPTDFYLETMGISNNSYSLDFFVELALKHSLHRQKKS